MSERPRPSVAACVVHWNTALPTSRCVDALQAMDVAPDRIVVVDNASSDGGVDLLRERHPRVTLLTAPTNVGFAAAVDLAAREVPDVDALWLVNSDAIPAPDALAALCDAWQAHGDALYGSVTLRRGARGVDWMEFPRKLLAPDGRWSPWRRDAPMRFDAAMASRAPLRVGAVLGSSLMVPMTLLRRHGGMAPEWFLHCEEIDWCLRLAREGVASWLVPASRVRHGGGGSHAGRAGVADVVAYYRARNEIVLARRHLGRRDAVIVAGKKLVRGLATLPWRASRGVALLRGVGDGLRERMGKRFAPEERLFEELEDALHGGLGPRLRGALGRSARATPEWITHRVGRSSLRYGARPAPFLLAFQQHCIARLARALERRPESLELAFDHVPAELAPTACRIGLQWEHTLVRAGGRDAGDAVPGATPLPDGSGTYLARLVRRAELEACDLIVDYSQPNRVHLERSGFARYAERSLVVSPQPWSPCFDAPRRDLRFVTLMHDLRQPRRARLHAEARRAGVPLHNVRGVYAPEQLRELHRRTRVLINLHQTDEHHSFEELRVLPALLCGVIVVSEDVPLRETIPYAEFVIWSRQGDLIETARAIEADHAREHARLFGDGRLLRVLEAMRVAEDAAIDRALARLVRTGCDGGARRATGG